MLCTQHERVIRNPGCCFFERVCLMWLIWCFVIVFVLFASLSRTYCLVVCCWLGCRSRGDRGRGSCWVFDEVAFHSIPFRFVSRRGQSLIMHLFPFVFLTQKTPMWPHPFQRRTMRTDFRGHLRSTESMWHPGMKCRSSEAVRNISSSKPSTKLLSAK